MEATVLEIPGRIQRPVRRQGLPRARGAAPYLSERPIWYALELPPRAASRPLPDGVTLRRGGTDDIDRLAPLLRVRPLEARERFRMADVEVWIAEEAGQPLFACWLFHDRVPAATAPGGWLELPPGVV